MTDNKTDIYAVIDRIVETVSNLKSGSYDYFSVGVLVGVLASMLFSPALAIIGAIILDWRLRKREG